MENLWKSSPVARPAGRAFLRSDHPFTDRGVRPRVLCAVGESRAGVPAGGLHCAVKFVPARGLAGEWTTRYACGSRKDPAAHLIEDMRCGIGIRIRRLSRACQEGK